MRKIKKSSMWFVLLICILCGCSNPDNTDNKSDDNSKQSNQVVERDDLYYPQYQNILLTDLQNCDIIFMKNMMAYDFTAFLYSIEELDENEIEVSFDTDMKCDVIVTEEESAQRDWFGYTLFCAYNDKAIEKYGDMVEGITFDDYTTSIVDNEEVPVFYTYQVYVNLDTSDENIEYYEDLEINKMRISYKDKVYDFDIGTIKYDPEKEFNEKFAEQLAGENSAIVTTGVQDYIALDNTNEGLFRIDLEECLLTENKEMTITSIGLSNVDGINLKEVNIKLTNEEQSIDVKYEEGDTLVIPQNTTVGISILGQLDSLKSQIGGYYSISIDVGYQIDGKDDNFQYQVLAKGYLLTPYEMYAYQVDGINIFDLYLSKTSYYDIYSD